MRIGVDVGGTFTDLVAWDGAHLRVLKIPSTPPDFHLAVIQAVRSVTSGQQPAHAAAIVHGSTVATNALLQRRGEPVAFITTEGFGDMLLIGRQNRPRLYALRVARPRPITPAENWFTVRERIDARGNVVEPLVEADVDRLIQSIQQRGLRHVAVCLLFSFINPDHERMIGAKCQAAGLTVTLSCDVLPEFREYERASTTTINASLRPTVQRYLELLERGLPSAPCAQEGDRGVGFLQSGNHRLSMKNPHPNPLPEYRERGPEEQRERGSRIDLRIMHSGGGTMRAREAAKHAARLVLSGPAGGVIGAAFVARDAGFADIISYDMGGTSTDVATVRGGRPQWTTASTIDGLPIGLPMFEINTVGAGGGSIAYVDAGGALRVGPQSAGAEPGPACYGRGGVEPTVTDANLVLGRILPDHFLGGAMRLDVDAAARAVQALAQRLGKSAVETALGIVTVVEANMAHAVRTVTSRRGHDPRGFALVCFGGAGGLHAGGLARSLNIKQVIVPPYAGVLSALGMIVAPPVVDISRTIVNLADALNDQSLQRLFEELETEAATELSDAATESIERFADVRFRGQSHEIAVRIETIEIGKIEQSFHAAYTLLYGRVPRGRRMEIVSLRVRRIGWAVNLALPNLTFEEDGINGWAELIIGAGERCRCRAVARSVLVEQPPVHGPLLVIDHEATTYVPPAWTAQVSGSGALLLQEGNFPDPIPINRE